jgi:nicotinamide riboside kinase
MAEALRIAVLGAESTGKTSLVQALRERLAAGGAGLRVAAVGEVLREWCDARGRTPQAHEQRAIAEEQHRRIDGAAAGHDVVISDTTALTTAVYSRYCFGDRSLEPLAVELHRRMHATLLMAVDLPWQADGFQRDGAHVREPVDALLRELLAAHALPFQVVDGTGVSRLSRAVDALQPLLEDRAWPSARADGAPRGSGAQFSVPDAGGRSAGGVNSPPTSTASKR